MHRALRHITIDFWSAFQNYEQQKNFLEKMIFPQIAEFTSEQCKGLFEGDPRKLLEFVGVGKLNGGPGDAVYVENARSIFRYTSFLS